MGDQPRHRTVGDWQPRIDINKKVTIIFKYYLNPDGTRNLEYDPNRNLFGKLPLHEWVDIKKSIAPW